MLIHMSFVRKTILPYCSVWNNYAWIKQLYTYVSLFGLSVLVHWFICLFKATVIKISLDIRLYTFSHLYSSSRLSRLFLAVSIFIRITISHLERGIKGEGMLYNNLLVYIQYENSPFWCWWYIRFVNCIIRMTWDTNIENFKPRDSFSLG